MRRIMLLATALSCASPAFAATHVVPDGFPTIAAALAVAAPSDTVLVRPGTYPERLVLVDGVVLLGEDPLNRPVIDGFGSGVVLTAASCGPGTIVQNFEIVNGAGVALGGGASLFQSSLHFENCRFSLNLADFGGAIGADESDFTASSCQFEANGATQSGGAISVTDLPSPTIRECSFLGNSAAVGGAIAVRNGCRPAIEGSLFDGNTAGQGAGIWFDFLAGGTVLACTLVGQDATEPEGGAIFCNPVADPLIDRTVVAFGLGGGALQRSTGSDPAVGCSLFHGNVGGDGLDGSTDLGGNLFSDPLFCDAAGRNYTVRDDSPCLPDPTCERRGAFDVGCTAVSAGAALETSTWGRLKAGWRN